MTNSHRVTWRAQLRRAAMLLGGVAVPVGWLLALPAAGAQPSAAPHTVTVADIAEAWYQPAPPVDTCTTPLGCPPDQAPTSAYPADTLHVGVAGGQETARTYLLPDLALVPFDARITSATMSLPVAAGTGDGTQSPDAAHMVACLVTEPFVDGAQGSTQKPPKTDCSVAAKTSYDAKKNVFTVDLAPITAAWHTGVPPLGVALVPDSKTTQPTDAWHVALNGRKRAASKHVSTTLTYVGGSTTYGGPVSLGGATSSAGSAPVSAAAPPPAAPPPANLPASTNAAPPASPPVVASPQQPAQVAQRPAAFVIGVPQPMAFVIPIVLLVAAIFFARVFTRDATPLRVRT